MSSATVAESGKEPIVHKASEQINWQDIITQTAAGSVYSAFVAWTFSIVSLPAALVFGATESLARSGIMYAIGDKGISSFEGFVSSLAKTALVYTASGLGAAWFTNAIGISMTLTAGLTLTAAMYITSCVITALALGCLCCTCLALLVGTKATNTTEIK